MIKILTVCGNGIGSSNLLAMKINQIAKSNQLDIEAKSSDFNTARGENPDLFVTVKEFADQFPANKRVATVRSYVNKQQIEEDIMPYIKEILSEKGE